MSSRVMLTGQVKRARGGTTWMLMEDNADGPVAASYDSQNENLCPNLQQPPGHWETSLSKLHIRESGANGYSQSPQVPNRRDGHKARAEEEARLRRIGEQYCLPTKELLAAGSQGEDSMRAILRRQKELLSEFRSHPLGALPPPSWPGSLQESFQRTESGQGHEFPQALGSGANGFDVSEKVARMQSSKTLSPISKNSELQVQEQRHHLVAKLQSSHGEENLEGSDTQEDWLQEQYASGRQQTSVAASNHSDVSPDMSVLPDHPFYPTGAMTTPENLNLNYQEPVVESAAGARAPLLPSRKLENQSLQPLLTSRTGCRSSAKASTPPSTLKQRVVASRGEGFCYAKAHENRSTSRPWVSSYKPATTGATLTKTTKSGARKPKLLSSSSLDQSGAEMKDKLDAGNPRQLRRVKHASSGTHCSDTTQEKHVMVFASQSKEWEEEMTTMAAEPRGQQHVWKDTSTSGSLSRSATASEPENGIGRYNMRNLTDLQKEILTLNPEGGRPVVMNDRMSSRKDLLTRSSRKSRRLSQVLRSEDDLSRQNKHYAVELQHLQEQLDAQDYEVESLRTAGMLLKNLYSKQSEELRALKASYPVTFKETAELRELCRKQEEELKLSRAALPAFKSQVLSLTSQVVSLKQDLSKVKADRDLTQQKLQSEQAAQNRRLLCKSTGHCDDGLKTQDPVRHPPRANFMKAYLDGNKETSVHGLVPYEEEEYKQVPHRGSSIQKTYADRVNQGFRRIGDKLLSDKELEEMLLKLHSYADREQAILQERCANTLRGLRHCHSGNCKDQE